MRDRCCRITGKPKTIPGQKSFAEIAIDFHQARFWMAKPKTTCVMNVVSPISCEVRRKSRQHSSIFHCSEPVPARLKEWAYPGFAINLASALIAHLSVGGGHRRALGALVLLLAQSAGHAGERLTAFQGQV
jgi:hypothetical protein